MQGITDLIHCLFVYKPELVLSHNYLTILHNTALGTGVTLLPEPVIRLVPLEQNVIIPLPDMIPEASVTYSAIWCRDNHSQLLRDFIDFLPELEM